MQTITALIPAYNEQNNIERCIKSLKWCNKIVVLNMGADKTGQIAKKFNTEVINKFKTKRPDFKLVQTAINWAIDNCKTDWMLRIDADEVVTAELQNEIISTIQQNNQITNNKMQKDIVAYGIPRRQFFLGGFLKGGDWAYDRLVRLFRPQFCRYDPVVAVHEQFKVNGKTGYLKNSLLHYSHPTKKELLEKFNLYTDIESRQLKQSLLLTLFNLITQPPYIYARWLFYHHGLRDGKRGLLAAYYRSYYAFLVYWKSLKNRLK